MTNPLNQDEQLIANLLRQVDVATQQGDSFEHLAEETLALFATGALVGDERAQAIQHLAVCAQCRRAASLLMSMDEPANPQSDSALESQVRLPRSIWHVNPRWAVWATAAALLTAVGSMFYWPSRNSQLAENQTYRQALAMLEKSEFDRVQQSVTSAEKTGIVSDRLRNLQAEAIRKIPASVALSHAGRLSDFGYNIGGVVARDPNSLPHREGLGQAEEILSSADRQNLEVILNRGHVLLSLDRTQEASTEFQRAVEMAPKDPLAWLGLGLACFVADDFSGAEIAFRQSVNFDDKSIPARINLAMTLEELGKNSAAVTEWQGLLKLPLELEERQEIELALEQMQPSTAVTESLK